MLVTIPNIGQTTNNRKLTFGTDKIELFNGLVMVDEMFYTTAQ
jgi:hypothetical protein